MSSPCSAYKIGVPRKVSLFDLYSDLKKSKVTDAMLDQGVPAPINYFQPGVENLERVGGADCQISEEEVFDYAVSNWEKYHSLIEKHLKVRFPWRSNITFKPFQDFLGFLETALMNAGYSPPGERFYELKGLSVFLWSIFPVQSILERLAPNQLRDFETIFGELREAGLSPVVEYILRSGGGQKTFLALRWIGGQPGEIGIFSGIPSKFQNNELFSFFYAAGIPVRFVNSIRPIPGDASLCADQYFSEYNVAIPLKNGWRVFDISNLEARAEKHPFYPVPLTEVFGLYAFFNSPVRQALSSLLPNSYFYQWMPGYFEEGVWPDPLESPFQHPLVTVMSLLHVREIGRGEKLPVLLQKLDQAPHLLPLQKKLWRLGLLRGQPEAAALSEEVLQADSQCPPALLVRAKKAVQSKQYREADSLFEKINHLGIPPVVFDASFYYFWGLAVLHLKQWDKAGQIWEHIQGKKTEVELRKEFPVFPLFQLALALQSGKLGGHRADLLLREIEEAPFFSKSGDLETGFRDWWNFLEENREMGDKILLAGIYVRWGDRFMLARKYELAEELYRKAAVMDAGNPKPARRLKEIELRREREQK